MKYIFPLFICFCFASCFNEGDCLISATNYMHIQFKKKSNHALDTAIEFAYQSIALSDTSYIIVRPATTELLLPVNISQGAHSTAFVFHRINADSTILTSDTLEVSYAAQTKIISKDCGAYTSYYDLKIIKTNLDSIQIKKYSTALIKDPTSSGISSYAVNYQIFF